MEPRLIEFPVHKDSTGNLAIADYDDIPFAVKRIFWVYDVVGERGDHALKTCHQLIVSMSEGIAIETRHGRSGKLNVFSLRRNVGLYLPPMVWRKVKDTGASFFVLCSHPFDPDDYIDGVEDFEKALMEDEVQKGLKFSDEETNYGWLIKGNKYEIPKS